MNIEDLNLNAKEQDILKLSLEEIAEMSSDELAYFVGRFCGPHNVCLRDKRYGSVGYIINRLAIKEQTRRAIEDILLGDSLSDET